MNANGPGWTHKAIRHICAPGDVAVGPLRAGGGVDTRHRAVTGHQAIKASCSSCNIHVCTWSAIGGVDRARRTVVSSWAICAVSANSGPWGASVGACRAIDWRDSTASTVLAGWARQAVVCAGGIRGGPVGARQAGLGFKRGLRTVVASRAGDANGRVGRASSGVVGARRARRGHHRGLWAVSSIKAHYTRVQRDHVGVVVKFARRAGDGGDCVGRAVGAPRAIPWSYHELILIRAQHHVAGQGALELGLVQVGADAVDGDVDVHIGCLALGDVGGASCRYQ